MSSLHAQADSSDKTSQDTQSVEKQRKIEPNNTVQAYRRGAIRSPRRSFNPESAPAARRHPGRNKEAAAIRRLQERHPPSGPDSADFSAAYSGGLALSTIFNSLFNPFAGFSLGSPLLSLLSIVLWVILILALFRRFRAGRNINVNRLLYRQTPRIKPPSPAAYPMDISPFSDNSHKRYPNRHILRCT